MLHIPVPFPDTVLFSISLEKGGHTAEIFIPMTVFDGLLKEIDL